MTRYAATTTVPVDRSRAEIERLLTRYGADQFMYGWAEDRSVIAFRAEGRQVKFELPLPDRKEWPTERAYEQAIRQRWRALALVIKAKLEAVESGITIFDDEFMAHLVLPDGRTMGQWARPQIAAAYESGNMPALMPGTEKRLESGR